MVLDCFLAVRTWTSDNQGQFVSGLSLEKEGRVEWSEEKTGGEVELIDSVV